jgi:tetratricopeptide (TPR) repeat protein
MKIRPIIIYLSVFVVFVVALIIFSNMAKKSNNPENLSGSQMPNDQIHKGMNSEGMGNTPSQSNVMQEAIEKLNKLKVEYEKNPSDTLKMREYADMLTLSHKSEEALNIYNQILTRDAKRVDVMLQQTFIYFNDGKFDKALEATNKALKIDNNHAVSKYNLGAIYNAMGQKEKAVSIWKEVAKNFAKTEVGHIAEQSLKQIEGK